MRHTYTTTTTRDRRRSTQERWRRWHDGLLSPVDREPALLLRESLDEGTRLLATVADDDADGRFRIALWALNTELATLLPAQARGLLSPKVPGRLAELRAARRPRIGAAASWRTRDSVVHSSGRLSTLGHCGSVTW